MATLRTVTVKSSGGDYTSLSNAEAGEQGDLPTLDRQLDIECYAFSDTTIVNITGWTTDATRYIRIFTPIAERHDGKWNDSKYKITQSSAYGFAITNLEEYVRLEGIQVRMSNTSTDGYGCISSKPPGGASSDVRVADCICWSSTTSTSGTDGPAVACGGGNLLVRNSVIIGGYRGASSAYNVATPSLTLHNVTVVNSNDIGIETGTSIYITATNVYVGGTGGESYGGSGSSFSKTTCMHSTATTFSGSTKSIAYSTANFTNVTASSEDLHLVSGSALIGAGTDLSGTFTTDIDGETRSAWDVGADEYISVAEPISVFRGSPMRMRM